jgi:hypothetical protein
MFHNIRLAKFVCSSKAKVSALSKVEMSVSPPFWEFGAGHFDGHGGDEQARAEPSRCVSTAGQRLINGSSSCLRLPDLEFAIYEKPRLDNATAAPAKVLLTLLRDLHHAG